MDEKPEHYFHYDLLDSEEIGVGIRTWLLMQKCVEVFEELDKIKFKENLLESSKLMKIFPERTMYLND